MRKVRPGLPSVDLTMDERAWLAGLLDSISAAVVVVERLPTEHPDFDRADTLGFKAGILEHMLDGWRRTG